MPRPITCWEELLFQKKSQSKKKTLDKAEIIVYTIFAIVSVYDVARQPSEVYN